jgi:hypothetical protein
MHVEPDLDALERSALELLAAGNGIASVAHVLGVSVATVEGWARAGPATRPMADEAPAAPAWTGAHDGSRRPHVEPTDFFAHRPATKAVLIGVPVALAALVMGSHLDATFRDANLSGLYHPMMAAGLLIGTYFIACALRGGFELTRDAVVFRDVFGRRELAYADIGYYRVTRNPKLLVYTLSLYPRSGASRMTIWFDRDEVCNSNVAAWLSSMQVVGSQTIPGVTSRVLQAVQQDGGAAGRSGNGVLVLPGLICAGLFLMSSASLVDSLRMVVQGPPARASLHIVDGRLVEAPECHHVRHSSYQVLKVDTGSAIVERTIPCRIEASQFTVPATWQIVLLSDDRPFAKHEMYEITLGGRVLRSYAGFARFERDNAISSVLIDLLLVLVWIPAVAYLYRTFLGKRAG